MTAALHFHSSRIRFYNLETVAGLLSIPDSARKRKLSPHAVLPHGSQGPSPLPLGLGVVGSEPELLQERLAAGREVEALQQGVQVSEAVLVKGDGGLGLQHALQLPGVRAGGGEKRGEAVEEASKMLDTTALQEDLAHAGNLLRCEDHRWIIHCCSSANKYQPNPLVHETFGRHHKNTHTIAFE